jgi:hypothetical protein
MKCNEIVAPPQASGKSLINVAKGQRPLRRGTDVSAGMKLIVGTHASLKAGYSMISILCPRSVLFCNDCRIGMYTRVYIHHSIISSPPKG